MNEVNQTKQIAVSYKSEDLKQAVIKGLIVATTTMKEKDYRFTVNGTPSVLDSFSIITNLTKDLEEAFSKCSKSTKKETYNRIRGLKRNTTIKKVNTFMSFLKSKVLKTQGENVYKFHLSERETNIQTARANWLVLRGKAEEALKVYKETKGDFYKG